MSRGYPRPPLPLSQQNAQHWQPGSRTPDEGNVLAPEVALFGDQIAEVLARTVGTELVGVYFVGSVALGGYVPGESDIDIAAVSNSALTDPQKQLRQPSLRRVRHAQPAAWNSLSTAATSWAHVPQAPASRSIATEDHGCPRPCTWTPRSNLASGT